MEIKIIGLVIILFAFCASLYGLCLSEKKKDMTKQPQERKYKNAFRKEDRKKCEDYLDHTPLWCGDCFACKDCGIIFAPVEKPTPQPQEKIGKIATFVMKKYKKTFRDLAGYDRVEPQEKHQSDCCHAPVKIVGGDEGTNHWECEKCGKSCNDLFYAEPQERKCLGCHTNPDDNPFHTCQPQENCSFCQHENGSHAYECPHHKERTLEEVMQPQEDKEFFNRMSDKLEELFEKGEECSCGKRLPCRSKALSFNAYANIYHNKLLQQEKDKFQKTLNSGRKMYELGKKEEREKIRNIVENEMSHIGVLDNNDKRRGYDLARGEFLELLKRLQGAKCRKSMQNEAKSMHDPIKIAREAYQNGVRTERERWVAEVIVNIDKLLEESEKR